MTCVWGVLARVEAWVSAGFGCCWRRAKPVQAFPSEKGKGASEESFPGAWRSLAHYEVCLLAFVNAWIWKKQIVPTRSRYRRELTSDGIPSQKKLADSQRTTINQVDN
jgi:hypothetical protein